MEDMRQICIYKSDHTIWWYYASMFGDQCLNSTTIKQCSETIMKTLRINVNEVNRCVTESFEGDPAVTDNQYLREERNTFVKRGVQSWPTLVINQIIFRVICFFYEMKMFEIRKQKQKKIRIRINK